MIILKVIGLILLYPILTFVVAFVMELFTIITSLILDLIDNFKIPIIHIFTLTLIYFTLNYYVKGGRF